MIFQVFYDFQRTLYNPTPITIFVLKMLCHPLFMSVACIQMHFRLLLIMEANIMNLDQTAPAP